MAVENWHVGWFFCKLLDRKLRQHCFCVYAGTQVLGEITTAMNRIQFQQGLSLPQFIKLYCTEEKCESSLEKARWPDGFRCPRCHAQEHGLSNGSRHKRYQCRSCRHQATLTAGTILEAT